MVEAGRRESLILRDISESRIILLLLSEMQSWQRGQTSTSLPMQTPQDGAALGNHTRLLLLSTGCMKSRNDKITLIAMLPLHHVNSAP